MYITDHRRTKAIDFGEFLMHSFFTGVQKIILLYYGLLCKSIKSVLEIKRRIQMNSILICIRVAQTKSGQVDEK